MRRQVQQHREPAWCARPGCRSPSCPGPMIRSPSQCPGTARSAASAGRSLIMTSAVTKLLAAAAGAGPRDAQRPAGAQARGQLAPQRAAALHVQRLVDRLVGDPHRLIIGEVDPQPAGDLLRAPRRRPPPVLPARPCRRPFHARPPGPAPASRRAGDRAGQPVLHVLAQRVVGGELGRLRAPGAPLGVPLRGRRPVLQPPAARRGVAAQLPRDRRRRPAQPAGDLAHARCPGAAAARSPPARRTTDTAPTAARRMIGAIPPPSRNHRDPTGPDTPHATAASSLVSPSAISTQNRRSTSRRAGGRPGDRIAGRPVSAATHPSPAPSHTSTSRCCDDHLNPP